MVKEAWNSLKDNIKDRVANPFLGTFIVVWITHNWQVVYSFFYFDKEWKLEKKVQYFKDYWSDKSFFWNLICVAAITVGILIITYLFLAISRYLANLFENRIIPFIQKISKGKIVTYEVYQNALDKINSLESKVEAERKAKNEAITERDEFEKRLYSGGKVIDGGVIDENRELNAIEDSVSINSDYSEIINKAIRLFNTKSLEGTLLDLDKQDYFAADDEVIDFLLKYDLIKLDRRSEANVIYYSYTENGKQFRRQCLDILNKQKS